MNGDDRGPLENADFVFPAPPLGLTEMESDWLRWFVITNDRGTATKLAMRKYEESKSQAAALRWSTLLKRPAARAYVHEIRMTLYRRSLLTVEDLLVELEAIALDPSMKVKYRLRALEQIRRVMMPAKHQHVHFGSTALTSSTGLDVDEKPAALPPAQKPGLRGLTLEQIGAVRQTLLGITAATMPTDDFDPPISSSYDVESAREKDVLQYGEDIPGERTGPVEPPHVTDRRHRIAMEEIEVLKSEREQKRRQERERQKAEQRSRVDEQERDHRRGLTDDFRRRLAELGDVLADGDGPDREDAGDSNGGVDERESDGPERTSDKGGRDER
jgi:hypothetical protein